jgi:hypothetical protein
MKKKEKKRKKKTMGAIYGSASDGIPLLFPPPIRY